MEPDVLSIRNFADDAIGDSNLRVVDTIRLICKRRSDRHEVMGLYVTIAHIMRRFLQHSLHRKIDTNDKDFACVIAYLDAGYDSKELYMYIYTSVLAKALPNVMTAHPVYDAPSEEELELFKTKLRGTVRITPSINLRMNEDVLNDIVSGIFALGGR